MSRWIRLAAAAVLGVAVVGCGSNGGDPVARQQIPAGPDDSSQESADSGSEGGSDQAGTEGGSDQGSSDQGGSDQGGSGQAGSGGGGSDGSGRSSSGGGRGSGSGGDHGRKIGLPESIRIPEIGDQAFEDAVAAACGSKDGAPGCLTVTYLTVADPDHGCGFEWVSDPPKSSTPEGTASIVQRGSHITATIFTCPEPEDTTSPAPEDTTAPAEDTTSSAPEDTTAPAEDTTSSAPGDAEPSISDSPAASP